jgi:transcriptional regulator with XRE-family HTH domain
MNLTVIMENIDRLLRVKKMSANKASDLAGKPDAIRNIQRKLKGEIKGKDVNVETLEALARVLGTTSADLRTKSSTVIVKPVQGLRESIQAKIEWLDKEREQALRELEALDRAEFEEMKPAKRKHR